MAKFGKFLLTTAAIVGTVATAYGIYKHKDTFLKTVTDDDDEDYDDFSEEEAEAAKPHYVPLNSEPTVSEVVKDVVENTVKATEDVAEDATDNFSPLPDQMAVEETVEEFFNDED